MKHLMLITTSFVLLLVLAGCRTSDKSKTAGFVYSIKNAEVRGNFLNFTLKNHNNRSLRKATVYIQLGIQNQESDFSEIPAIEKTFECNLNHLEKTDFSICLSEYDLFMDKENELSDLLTSGDIYIKRIYAEEITFDNDLLWYDKYGNWCFW